MDGTEIMFEFHLHSKIRFSSEIEVAGGRVGQETMI